MNQRRRSGSCVCGGGAAAGEVGFRYPPHEVNSICDFLPLIGREVNKLPTRGLP